MFAVLAYHQQVKQGRIALWRDLSKEFDHSFKQDRARCVGAFQQNGKLAQRDVHGIMDLFETVALLYFKNGIDRELTKETFDYYLASYFVAAKEALDLERKEDTSFYEKVYALAAEWGSEREMPEKSNLTAFFVEEERFCERMGQE